MANTTATLEAIGMRDPWSALNSVPADRLSIAALVLSTSFALWFVSKLYTARSHFAKLRKDGLVRTLFSTLSDLCTGTTLKLNPDVPYSPLRNRGAGPSVTF